jgi:hypothetical protein
MLNISAACTVGILKYVVRALGLWGLMSVIGSYFSILFLQSIAVLRRIITLQKQ